jgi:hypothetical protein
VKSVRLRPHPLINKKTLKFGHRRTLNRNVGIVPGGLRHLSPTAAEAARVYRDVSKRLFEGDMPSQNVAWCFLIL